MSPLRMGRAKVVGVSAAELVERTGALETAVERGGSQLDPAAADRARAVVDKVRTRTGLTGGHTVVALAGATGSGKSSLFNALVGSDVATIGARRPTTSTPTAAVWGAEPAGELLDWLGVGTRHTVPSTDEPGHNLDGLVLIDLPDFDSRESSHRAEAERVLELVDVFLWVTDPQKYADARLHHDYVATLSTHDAVMLVVLNQVDRLTPAQAQECVADLTRLLTLDGLRSAKVVATSAVTGEGVQTLRERLANAVAGQNAARARLAADVSAAATVLVGSVGDHDPVITSSTRIDLVDALARAAGIPTVVGAVERDYVHQAVAHTGWPFTRWVRTFRPSPLKRFRLDVPRPDVTSEEVQQAFGRSSLPPATPAARAAVDLATRRLTDEAAASLPTPWSDAVDDAARPAGSDLTDALDQAVLGTSLQAPRPAWWTVLGAVQLALAAAAGAGLVWLVVLGVLGWLQLPEIDTPRLGWFPVPLVLLVLGLLAGVALAGVGRLLARTGARRRARAADDRLRSAVSVVAEDRLVTPVVAVLDRHAAARHALGFARATR